MKFYFEIRTGM